jgi:DNA-nicking Smr family endonuclease
MAKQKEPKADLNDADAALWQSVVASARPLKKKPLAQAPEIPSVTNTNQSGPTPKVASPESAPAKPHGRPAHVAAPVPAPQPPPLIVHSRRGTVAGVDRQSTEALRKGELRIEDRIDLHGRTQIQAHAALSRFLTQCQAAGLRCVLVVTGKGEQRIDDPDPPRPSPPGENRRGILREMLPRWLNEPANRDRILMMSPARPKDGGAGAFYVLLRRSRD